MQAVLALYAQENGQGMMFPADEEGGEPPTDIRRRHQLPNRRAMVVVRVVTNPSAADRICAS
jgi:stringent starvation protein B